MPLVPAPTPGTCNPAKRVQRFAVHPGDAGNVFGRFQSALNLERGHATADQIRQDIDAGEILRTEEIASVPEIDLLAVGDELVGQAARLRAFAPVGGTPSERLAGQAL